MNDHYMTSLCGKIALNCLGWLCWVFILSFISCGCVTKPPSIVQIQAGNYLDTARRIDMDAADSLRLTTFNVWGLPSWMNGASPDRFQKISAALDKTGSDVVLLQEVWTRRSFAELSEQAKGSARQWWTACARHKGTFLGQNGLLTLSRYPIIDAKVMHFSSASMPDSLMCKGVLRVTILVRGERFNVWNVHLQDGGSMRVRSRQITQLIGWIQDSREGQIADIVGGDFNFTPESAEFHQFVAAVGPDVHQLAGDTAFPTWDGLKIGASGGQALDHIFVKTRRPTAEIRALPRRLFTASRMEDRLSDHMGMEAVMTFGRPMEDPQPVLVGQRASFPLLGTSVLTRR
jgi:endonuclease/exonuclease/phosphatase family metal-dependent hydrolase